MTLAIPHSGERGRVMIVRIPYVDDEPAPRWYDGKAAYLLPLLLLLIVVFV